MRNSLTSLRLSTRQRLRPSRLLRGSPTGHLRTVLEGVCWTYGSFPRRTRKDCAMHTRTLGQGLQVSAIGLGCMSTTGAYKAPTSGPRRDDRHAARRTRSRGHVLRHCRDLRDGRQRGACRRGAGPDPRPGRHRDEVCTGHRLHRAQAAWADAAPIGGCGGARRISAALGGRRDRPVLPAPGQPRGAHRGVRGRPRRADRRREDQALGMSEAAEGTISDVRTR